MKQTRTDNDTVIEMCTEARNRTILPEERDGKSLEESQRIDRDTSPGETDSVLPPHRHWAQERVGQSIRVFFIRGATKANS